jgi:hypothetical protein
LLLLGVEDRPPFGDLGCALGHGPAIVPRSHTGVIALRLPHEGLASGEGGGVVTREYIENRSTEYFYSA